MSFSAWAAILLVAQPSVQIGGSVSPAERRAWVGLTFIAIIYLYFLTHIELLSNVLGGTLPHHSARKAGQTLALLAIGWTVVSSMVRRKARGEVIEDERDRAIAARADRLSHGFLVVGLIGIVVTLGLSPEERLDWATPRLMAGMILNLLILKTLLEHSALVALHWRGRR